jgi:hypothetical protein
MSALEKHMVAARAYKALSSSSDATHRQLVDAYRLLTNAHRFATAQHAKATVAYGVAKKRHIEMMAGYAFEKVQFVASVVEYEAEMRT